MTIGADWEACFAATAAGVLTATMTYGLWRAKSAVSGSPTSTKTTGKAFLKGALVTGANLATVDLRGADLEGLRDWAGIRSASYLNIEGVRHAPAGFRQWALEHGAIEGEPPPAADSGQGYSSLFRTI